MSTDNGFGYFDADEMDIDSILAEYGPKSREADELFSEEATPAVHEETPENAEETDKFYDDNFSDYIKSLYRSAGIYDPDDADALWYGTELPPEAEVPAPAPKEEEPAENMNSESEEEPSTSSYDPVAEILAELDSVGGAVHSLSVEEIIESTFSHPPKAAEKPAAEEEPEEPPMSVDDILAEIFAGRDAQPAKEESGGEAPAMEEPELSPEETPVILPAEEAAEPEYRTYRYTGRSKAPDPKEDLMSEHTRRAKTAQDADEIAIEINDTDPDAELYADIGSGEEAEAPKTEQKGKHGASTPFAEKTKKTAASAKDTAVKVLAYIGMRFKQARVSLRTHSEEDEDLGEEMSPEMAARFYDDHLSWLRLRTKLSFVFAVVLMYLSFDLPVFGALRDTGVKSAVCLILLIGSMLTGLDIITDGLLSLVRRRPNANTLIAVSSLLCVIDAFIIAAGHKDDGIPYCAIPALTIALSLFGSVMSSHSARIAFNNIVSRRNLCTMFAEPKQNNEDITLVKVKHRTSGLVRRIEEAGPDESVYAVMAPFLLIAALLFSLIAAFVAKNFAGFAHILSGMTAAAAPVIMLITFPLPFYISARGLISRGTAIAGWAGLNDIGTAKDVVVEDKDLFPKDTVTITKIKLLVGIDPAKVISYAGSVIAASGSVLAPAFRDIMRKGNGELIPIERFSVHESGGLIALMDGNVVYCGDAAFMQLIHVRLPQQIIRDNRVYVAVGDALYGMFDIGYTVTPASKKSLYSLIGSDCRPVFALRDFNMTKKMLSVKFDTSTDGLDFPDFTERYRLSDAEPGETGRPAAIVSRDGLETLAGLTQHGKMLHKRIRTCVLLSVLCTVIGMAAMFICSMFGTVPAVFALAYMLIWLIPVFVLSITVKIP